MKITLNIRCLKVILRLTATIIKGKLCFEHFMQYGNLSKRIFIHGFLRIMEGSCYLVWVELWWVHYTNQRSVKRILFLLIIFLITLIMYADKNTWSTIVTWFLCICTEHESKYEHDHSHLILKDFLKHEVTKSPQSKCISVILKYAEALFKKEKYLSNHYLKYVTNCMDMLWLLLLNDRIRLIMAT